MIYETPAWFAVQAQPKHEHIAGAHLRQERIEVFMPRIRFKRISVRGPVWVTEALFPGYLFARFNWYDSLRLVAGAHGVSKVVNFGRRAPLIPDSVIDELRQTMGHEDLRVIPECLEPGEIVEISGGAMHGLTAVVSKVLPARKRVLVLLEFLGRQTSMEIDLAAVVPEESARARLR